MIQLLLLLEEIVDSVKDDHSATCHKLGHIKDTCWKLHGKPANWKPHAAKTDRETRGNNQAAISNTSNQQPLYQRFVGHASSIAE